MQVFRGLSGIGNLSNACMVIGNVFTGSPVFGAVRVQKPGTVVSDNFGVPD